MKLEELKDLARKLEPNESLFTLPHPRTRLGEAVTELLSIVSEEEIVRWGQLEVWFMSSAGLSKGSANKRLKHLHSMGLIATFKVGDKTFVSLTNLGESHLESRKSGINVPIRFQFRAKHGKNW